MTKSARMFLMSSRDNRMNDRFRDDRNRERYDDGRYAPQSRMDEPENRRYSDGRFAPRSRYDMRYDDRMDDRYRTDYRVDDRYRKGETYRMEDYIPPVYRGDEMNRIGFRDHDTSYVGDPVHERRDKMMGHASGYGEKLDRETAERWMRSMENADGSTGAHWTKEQTNKIMQQKGLDHDPIEFWAAMNATYSDFCKVSAKYGVDNIDYYVDLACAFWLKDKDAVQDKLSTYYEYVVKH